MVDDPRIGVILDGRYRVVERLAAGGMGQVYRGERVKLGREVAIKFLHAWAATDPSFIKRFEVEARAMARLQHPNCASVIDFGAVSGQPYVVMDLVGGRSLRQVLDDGPMPVGRALDIARQILAGLAHAHGQGITHRDVKPENVMVEVAPGFGDQVRLLDFGLAKMSAGSPGLTSGFALGTPSYMAPEQTLAQKVDARTDVYAVGVVLFEMLTGDKPFVDDDAGEVMRKQREEPPPRLARRAPDAGFSDPLEEVVACALAKAPDERFASAADMAVALDAVPEAGEIRGRRVTADDAPPPGNRTMELSAFDAEELDDDEARPATPSTVAAAAVAVVDQMEAESIAARAPTAQAEPAGDAGTSASRPRAAVTARLGGRKRDAAEPDEPPDGGAHGGADDDRLGEAAPFGPPAVVVSGEAGTSGAIELPGAAGPVLLPDPVVAEVEADDARPTDGSAPRTAGHGGEGHRPLTTAEIRSRWWMAATAGLALAAVIAIVAIVAGGDDSKAGTRATAGQSGGGTGLDLGGDPDDPDDQLDDMTGPDQPADPTEPDEIEMPVETVPPPQLAALKKKLRGARTSRSVVRALQRLGLAHPRHPEIPLLLGQIYFDRLWVDDGLERFRRAIRIDPGYRTNPALIRSALNGFGNDRHHGKVRRFLAREIGEPAVPYLQEVIDGPWRKEAKQRAAATLRDLGH